MEPRIVADGIQFGVVVEPRARRHGALQESECLVGISHLRIKARDVIARGGIVRINCNSPVRPVKRFLTFTKIIERCGREKVRACIVRIALLVTFRQSHTTALCLEGL